MALHAARQALHGRRGPLAIAGTGLALVIVVGALATGGATGPRSGFATASPGSTTTANASATASATAPATAAPSPAGTTPAPIASPAESSAPSWQASSPPSVAPSTAPSPSVAADWASIAVEPFVPVAELEAERADASGVASDTTFRLTSRTTETGATLAARITVEPALAFTTDAGPDAATVRLRPLEALVPGATYRFLLRSPAGALRDSWIFQAAQPLHVVTTLPGDEATGVPLDSGIEITFDQDGVTAAGASISIEPSVAGVLEEHGRTIAFVPSEALAPDTVYTVTVKRGVRMAGSEQILETDVVFAFETAGTTTAPEGFLEREIQRPIFESPVAERPILGVQVFAEDVAVPRTLPVEVHRLPSLGAAVAAARQILTAPTWARWSSQGVVPTDGLPRVAAFDGALEALDDQGGYVIRFPVALDAGWYLVTIPRDGRDAQALLQVTDVAVYAMTTETRTLAWVNDTATGNPIAGATVAMAGGERLATTATSGLATMPTPAEFRSTDWEAYTENPPLLVVTASDGRAAISAPGLQSGSLYAHEARNASSSEPNDRYWLVLSTDRTQLRQSDSLNVFGVIRERDTGRVPAEVEVRLISDSGEGGDSNERLPAILVSRVAPDARGVFSTSLTFRDLPLGSYTAELRAGEQYLGTTWISIADIRKPAYAIDVTTDRHAYVAGETMVVTSEVGFFDGTLAPGVELRVRGALATTDAAGRATVRLPAGEEPTTEGWWYENVYAAPARPEEGEIDGWAPVVIFPSTRWLAATGAQDEARIRISGTLSDLDRERIERELSAGTDLADPAGDPIAGGAITATVTEIIPVRTVMGKRYDFITKRVVTIYSYGTREERVGRETLRSAADGTFSLAVPISAADHDHRVSLRTVDGDGRAIELTLNLAPANPAAQPGSLRPVLGDATICGSGEPRLYRLGEAMTATFRDAGGALPSSGDHRYLFTVSSRGLLDAVVQDSPAFGAPFADEFAPNAEVGAVWFTGSGYVPAAAPLRAAMELSEKALTVTLTPDRARYRPGERVTLTVRTLDPAGRPTSASVVVRAVDEKLYAIGAAGDIDLLRELYRPVETGVLGTSASHQPPYPASELGCGDTTGGGGDFRDWLLFRTITTGPDGTATVSFPLSDDLTSWHVSAAALNARLEAGSGAVGVPVGLPFFVEAVLAPEYLVDDLPVLRLRAFGDDLDAGDAVRFSVEAPSLGLAATTLDGAAFEASRITLPDLRVGEHRVIINATTGTGADARTYRLVRTFTVVPARVTRSETRVGALTADWRPESATGLTTVTVSDTGRGRLLGMLGAMADGSGARLDQALAAAVARSLLIETFGLPAWTLPPAPFEAAQFQRDSGLALLPYAAPDLLLTIRAVLAAPDRFDPALVREALGMWVFESEATRERRAMALAGLAALGEPVHDLVTSLAAEDDLTIREQLYVGLALAALGDDAAARPIEQALLAAHGQRLGSWVRLQVGASLDDTLDATGLLALLAASVGDPLAADAEAYLEANPGHDDLFVLHQLAYVRRALERADPAAGQFAVTIDGVRTVRDLEPGATWTLTLIPAQLAALRLEPVAGSLAVATVTQVPFDGSAADPDPDVTLERTVSPAGPVPEDGLVRVTLTLRFGPQATSACYEVNDRLPSGLAPLARSEVQPEEDEEAGPGGLAPYLVEGQRVSWCVAPDRAHPVVRLVYSARVVSPGTYRWEAATVQSTAGGDQITSTPPIVLTVR